MGIPHEKETISGEYSSYSPANVSPQISRSSTLKSLKLKLISQLLYDSYLTTIVSASRTYCVVHIVSTAIWAYCQCWSNCLIVSSSFEFTCHLLSSFMMCHCSLYLIVSNSCLSIRRACSIWGLPPLFLLYRFLRPDIPPAA